MKHYVKDEVWTQGTKQIEKTLNSLSGEVV